jgi:hypothetical protein
MNVNPLQPVSVSISPSTNPVCAGTGVTLTATPINGGAPLFQWFKNGYSAGIGETYSFVPVNGDQIYVVMSSSIECLINNPAVSNTVTMIVNPLLPVSVSIAASANPVFAGTSVAFTPTPTNGGSPLFQWFKNGYSAGIGETYTYVPVNGDQIYVTMSSSEECLLNNPAVSNVVTMIVNPLPYIIVTSPNGGENWLQGSLHNITWNDNFGENVKIDLYKAGAINGTLVASAPSTGTWPWIIPTDQPTGIDYKVKITSTADNTLFDFSDNDFTVTATVPDNLIVGNKDILIGQSRCFDANSTITVAGNSTTFVVQGGGIATFIAGMNIIYKEGTLVRLAGLMHGSIAPGGPYCGAQQPAMVTVVTGEEAPGNIDLDPFFTIYPNPTSGSFTLVMKGIKPLESVKVDIYGMKGERIRRIEIAGEEKHEVSMENSPAGLYFIRIMTNEKAQTIKLMKTN